MFYIFGVYCVSVCSCAELLVLKAELELMKGAGEASVLDLEQVRHLLDLCTGNQIFDLHFITELYSSNFGTKFCCSFSFLWLLL